MKLISSFLVLILILSVHSLLGQGLPKFLPVKNSGLQALTDNFPMREGLGALSAKPEIPYLKELRQIQSLKQSYDSLKSEL